MFEFREAGIPGLKTIHTRLARDVRGSFAKTFHASMFQAAGLSTDFRETYYSVSRKDVVRGMHFQLPGADHDKVVYCLEGSVLDVTVDLRVGSPTFRHHAAFQLSGDAPIGLYIPRGCAHGFLTQSDSALLLYSVETEYSASADAGISWDSIGLEWPVSNPILSERDLGFPTLQQFKSPFMF